MPSTTGNLRSIGNAATVADEAPNAVASRPHPSPRRQSLAPSFVTTSPGPELIVDAMPRSGGVTGKNDLILPRPDRRRPEMRLFPLIPRVVAHIIFVPLSVQDPPGSSISWQGGFGC